MEKADIYLNHIIYDVAIPNNFILSVKPISMKYIYHKESSFLEKKSLTTIKRILKLNRKELSFYKHSTSHNITYVDILKGVNTLVDKIHLNYDTFLAKTYPTLYFYCIYIKYKTTIKKLIDIDYIYLCNYNTEYGVVGNSYKEAITKEYLSNIKHLSIYEDKLLIKKSLALLDIRKDSLKDLGYSHQHRLKEKLEYNAEESNILYSFDYIYNMIILTKNTKALLSWLSYSKYLLNSENKLEFASYIYNTKYRNIPDNENDFTKDYHLDIIFNVISNRTIKFTQLLNKHFITFEEDINNLYDNKSEELTTIVDKNKFLLDLLKKV